MGRDTRRRASAAAARSRPDLRHRQPRDHAHVSRRARKILLARDNRARPRLRKRHTRHRQSCTWLQELRRLRYRPEGAGRRDVERRAERHRERQVPCLRGRYYRRRVPAPRAWQRVSASARKHRLRRYHPPLRLCAAVYGRGRGVHMLRHNRGTAGRSQLRASEKRL